MPCNDRGVVVVIMIVESPCFRWLRLRWRRFLVCTKGALATAPLRCISWPMRGPRLGRRANPPIAHHCLVSISAVLGHILVIRLCRAASQMILKYDVNSQVAV